MHRSLPARISTLAAGVALATFVSQAAAAEEWKFAIEEIDGSVQDAYAQEFKKRIEEKTGGDVTVTIYPYGALGTSSDMTELVTQGAVQFANASPGHLGTMVPEIQVFSIPYLLSESNEVNKQVLTQSDVIYNQLHPGYESALGVAYGFALGCAVHLVAMLAWMAVRRSKMGRSEWIAWLVSFGVLILLTILSNGGALSRMSA